MKQSRFSGKILAVFLAAALVVPQPILAVTLAAPVGRAPIVAGTLSSAGARVGFVRPVSLSNLSLKTPVAAPRAIPEMSPAPAAIGLPALSRHPVLDILEQIQNAGVALPETMDSVSDAAGLAAAASAMPAGPARDEILNIASSLTAARGSGSGVGMESDALKSAYDKGMGLPQETAATMVSQSGVMGALSRLLPSSWSKSRVEKTEPSAKARDSKNFEVPIKSMRWSADTAMLPASTKDITSGERPIVGQDRALNALYFGLKMPGDHYNLFAAGADGSGRATAVDFVTRRLAPEMPTPSDRVAVTNFEDKEQPVILDLPAGAAPGFQAGVTLFVRKMQMMLPNILNSGKMAIAKKQLHDGFQQEAAKARKVFDDEVAAVRLGSFGLSVWTQQTEQGLALMYAPSWQGNILTSEEREAKVAAGEFSEVQWNEAVSAAQAAAGPFIEKLKALLEQSEQAHSLVHQKMSEIDAQMAEAVASALSKPLMELVSGVPAQSHDDAAHQAFQAKTAERMSQFAAEVASLRSGRYGIEFHADSGQFAITRDGQALDSDQLKAFMDSGEITQTEWKTVMAAIERLVQTAKTKYQEMAKLNEADHEALHAGEKSSPPSMESMKAMQYVASLAANAAANYRRFIPAAAGDHGEEVAPAKGGSPVDPMDWYSVGVLATNQPGSGAPVVWARFPSLKNLTGVIEDSKRAMIVPGVGVVKMEKPGGATLPSGYLTQANGGILVVDVMEALHEPGSWRVLMQAIRNGAVEINEEGMMGVMSGQGKNYRVPVKVKVVLIGSPFIRMMLGQHDEDFARSFNASAEFESALTIGSESIAGYLDFFKKAVTHSAGEILDMTRGAMGMILEYAARLVDSHDKLTAQFGLLHGVLREASFWAREQGRAMVDSQDIEAAFAARDERENGIVRRVLEAYKRGIYRVQTSGSAVGQINGLAVVGSFGVPKRITVTATAGTPGLVSVDRDAKFTGGSFDKALGVVEGFLQHTFAKLKALSAQIRISFEQSHGMIDGDSATSTEIYATLSALSGVPIRQDIAVTGSADQFGNVQIIGGANEKIEGFFGVAKLKGLTGTQGVIIPAANVADLMLSPEIVEAVRAGQFRIYAVNHVSEGIEILTGVAYSEIVRRAEVRLEDIRKAGKGD